MAIFKCDVNVGSASQIGDVEAAWRGNGEFLFPSSVITFRLTFNKR